MSRGGRSRAPARRCRRAIRAQESVAGDRNAHEVQSRSMSNGSDRFLSAADVPDAHGSLLIGGHEAYPARRTLTIGVGCTSGVAMLAPLVGSQSLTVPA